MQSTVTKKPDTVKIVTYSLLIIVNVLLHMVLSGINVAGLFLQIFTEWTGIFKSIGFMMQWLLSVLLSTNLFYIIGLTIAFEFVILPVMVRWKYLTVKPNLLLSFIFAIYFVLMTRILFVIFG